MLKDKEKISLQDINDIEKKIDSAYSRVMTAHIRTSEKTKSGSRNDNSLEKYLIYKTQQMVEDHYKSMN